MPTFQGQTGTVLKIKLTSALLDARWGLDEVSLGGYVTLEASTSFVSDGSDIEFHLKDMEGNSIDVLKGKVIANFFRSSYVLSKPNKTGGMFFEVELKAHGLKGIGPKIKVLPPVRFKDLKWLDEKGEKELTEVQDGKAILCQAAVEGAAEGAMVQASVILRTSKHNKLHVLSPHVAVKEGKIRFAWSKPIPLDINKILTQAELDKHGGKYYQPEYLFSLELRGIRIESKPLKIVQSLVLRFEEWPGIAGMYEGKTVKITEPDGTTSEKKIPKDGKIEILKTKPGKYGIESVVLPNLKPIVLQKGSVGNNDFAINWKFIAKMEGTRNDVYVPLDKQGKVLGISGSTIASGFDLGQIDSAGFKKYGFSSSIETKLAPYVGKKGVAAQDYVKINPLRLLDAEILEINRIVHSKYAIRAEAYYNQTAPADNKFKSLLAPAQTAFASVFFQYGQHKSTGTLREKLLAKDYKESVNTLLHFTARTSEVENIKTHKKTHLMQYLSRRCQEARYLLKAIQDEKINSSARELISSREKEWEDAFGKKKNW